jgi:signal transduction histidine kinase
VLVALGTKGPALLVLALAIYTLASRGGLTRRASLTALAATAVVMAVAALAAGPDWGALVTGPLLATAGWLAGENARSRRAQAAAAGIEREDRVRRAATDERMRIARELHDVVAHAMSVIAVRSGVARMVLDTQPDQAREALGIIEDTSREALQQMRQLVGVLREPGDTSDLGPAPGLEDLPGLVDGIGQAGVAVDVRVEGRPRRLPPALDLSVYRVIQEALTNVVRHAGPTSAELRVAYSPESIEVEITDHGEAAPVFNGGGHGLVGMRERVAAYGGELSAGPTADGFRVRARLPITGGVE